MAFNILIVDDSLPMRGVLKKTIKASGFSMSGYEEAADGLEALKVLKGKSVDVVITDYNMPNMDGIELIKSMKNDNMLNSIPVIVITTEGSNSKIGEFTSLGAGYIKKPFTPEAIKAKLDEILGEDCKDEGFTEDDDNLDF